MALFTMRDSWNVWRRKINEALGGLVEPVNAEDVVYDNTDSGLTATDVQSAIDELSAKECSLYSDVSHIDSPISVSDSTWTAVNNITVQAGTYLFIAHCRFAANATGIRVINIGTENWNGSQSVLPANTGSNIPTTLDAFNILTVNDETTYYVNAYQTSGSAVDVNVASFYAIKLS